MENEKIVEIVSIFEEIFSVSTIFPNLFLYRSIRETTNQLS